VTSLKEVFQHNRREAMRYKAYIRLMPKVVILYAADSALAGAMQPAAGNYSAGNSGQAGSLMPHSSSNAAWNWRISFGAQEGPLNDKAADGDNSSLIGYAFQRRGSTSDAYMIPAVIAERRIRDINKKLFYKLFGTANVKSVVIPEVSLYNNIDRISKDYARNANLENVKNALKSYAASGVQVSYGILKSFMRGGTGSAPDVEGLLSALKASQGGNFVNWK